MILILKILILLIGIILDVIAIINFVAGKSDKERMYSVIIGFVGFVITRIMFLHFLR